MNYVKVYNKKMNYVKVYYIPFILDMKEIGRGGEVEAFY